MNINNISNFLTSQKKIIAKYLTYLIIIFSSIVAILNGFFFIGKQSNITFQADRLMWLVNLDLVALLALTTLVARNLFKLWLSKDKIKHGNRLRTRVLLIFCLLATIPTILVVLFSSIFFNASIKGWFDKKVSTAIEQSVAVAESYLEEHKSTVRADILGLAYDLDRYNYLYGHKDDLLANTLEEQMIIRSLSEIIIFKYNLANREPEILSHAPEKIDISLISRLVNNDALKKADQGEIVLFTPNVDDAILALIKLQNYYNTYVLVSKFADFKTLQHIESTQGAAKEYLQLKSQINKLQIQFLLIFVLIAFLILLTAIVVGMLFANYLFRPIGWLVDATIKITSGNFDVKIKEGKNKDEINILAKAFNEMAATLNSQQQNLILANEKLKEEKHFTEAILERVSSGVIALDYNLNITMANSSADRIYGEKLTEKTGESIFNYIPELTEFFDDLSEKVKLIEKQLEVFYKGKKIVLLFRIAFKNPDNYEEGYIITFDDITKLLSAERRAAWSGVARRIAHEIKNPLTPIQLAAERIKRKYPDEIDKDIIDRSTDTIIKYVKSINSMVEEFINFARLPSPKMKQVDLVKLLNDAIFTQRMNNSSNKYNISNNCSNNSATINGDSGQLNQVFLNLFKNSEEVFEENNISGRIDIEINEIKDYYEILVKDNGPGYPEEIMHLLSEPYVTTKARGSGLGLAIVKKIIDDHGGEVKFQNAKEDNNGAVIKILLPKQYNAG